VRVVSLVPSLTEAVAHLGYADRLVGVTKFCTVGAPPHAARLRGTKNPALGAVLALKPDLVLANTEENRSDDLDALRAAGVEVLETFPHGVDDVGPLLEDLAAALGAPGAAGQAAAEVERAAAAAAARAPEMPIATLTLIWRKPWVGVGPGTFVDDLLMRCGFANVLSGWDDRYPRLDPALVLRPEVVLLPSEPYEFGDDDLPAVHELLGDVPQRFVDGRLLTWHGPSTATALRVFSDLALELDADLTR
jgi:ABC-type Fe3+-hydroxamate transport system substrate-binding protein